MFVAAVEKLIKVLIQTKIDVKVNAKLMLK